MKRLIGLLLIIVGIVIGFYAGLWWGFIGGIVMVIEAIKADPIASMDIALGIVRFFFAGVIGWGAGILVALPGIILIYKFFR